jgi:hypothetical protein
MCYGLFYCYYIIIIIIIIISSSSSSIGGGAERAYYLSTLNLSDITSKFRTVTMFVIVDLFTIARIKFVGMFMVCVQPNVTCLAPLLL